MQSEKAILYDHIDLYRGRLGVPLEQPLKLVEVLRASARFDVEYCNFKTPGLCGAAMVGDKTDTIILNSNRTSEEQNFDCGHEFTHLAEHRYLQDNFNCFTKSKPQQNSFREWQANEGSAQLLVPYQDFIPRFLELLDFGIIGIPAILAEHYHVTPQVINIRLNSLANEIDQYQNGVCLHDIELLARRQRKARGILSTDYNSLCAFALGWDSVIGF